MTKVYTWLFSFLSFFGAFLLFLIQPMAGKALLPGFGGSFMVWAVAISLFQGLLLIGYLLTHLLWGRSVSRGKFCLFLGLVLAGVFFSRIDVHQLSKGPGSDGFLLGELKVLATQVALPFLCLSTTSVTLQRLWVAMEIGGVIEPFFLYAASNAGSLAALLSYPFLIEARFDLPVQARAWTWGFLLWALLWILFLFQPMKGGNEASQDEVPEEISFLGWFMPAMAGSALLVSTTNILTLDVASMPLLWVLPMVVYLWTFIKAFGQDFEGVEWWAEKFPSFLAFGFSLALINFLGFALGIIFEVLAHLLALYALCLSCHALLAFERPRRPENLTRFYLAIALGGWVGSALVAFIVPRFFAGFAEYALSLFLVAASIWREKFWSIQKPDQFLPLRGAAIFFFFFVFPAVANQGMPQSGSFVISATTGAIFYGFIVFRDATRLEKNRVFTAMLILISLLLLESFGHSGRMRFVHRNYYGIYRVFDSDEIRYLQMGSTYHGHEWLDPGRKGIPLMYYHAGTTIGQFMSASAHKWERMGVLGLGAGVLASFGSSAQRIDFFELDPDGLKIANDWFSYLKKATASVSVSIGDGRLELRKMPPGTFDLLFMDAFSSDSIPIHLLTLEAVQEYLRLLKQDGILLFHISNRHVNLVPVLQTLGEKLELDVRVGENMDSENPIIYPTRWVALGHQAGMNKYLSDLPQWKAPPPLPVKLSPWTDTYSNLLYVLTYD